MKYRFAYPDGVIANLTEPQREKAAAIAERFGMTHTVTVRPMFGVEGAICLDTGTMDIGILTDGSSHT